MVHSPHRPPLSCWARRREAVPQPVPLTQRAPPRHRGSARAACEGEVSTARVKRLPPAAVVGPKTTMCRHADNRFFSAPALQGE